MIETIKNNFLEVSVKNMGAELTSLKTVKDGLEFLWQGDEKYWTSQSLILFPIIGGLPDDKYILYGQEYTMNSHGFAKDMEFELVDKTEAVICYKISHDESTLKQYPFKFELLISYIIEGNTLKHRFRVNNLDDKEMLFSVGGHPGFNCPLYPGEKMENYHLVFEKTEKLERRLKAAGLLTGEKREFMNGEKEKTLEHSLFYNGAVILDNVASRWLEIRSSNNPRVIRAEFDGFPYLGIWSAKNDGPYVCIEPWYGIDSTSGDSYDFENKEGLLRLQAGKSFECEYRIIVE